MDPGQKKNAGVEGKRDPKLRLVGRDRKGNLSLTPTVRGGALNIKRKEKERRPTGSKKSR